MGLVGLRNQMLGLSLLAQINMEPHLHSILLGVSCQFSSVGVRMMDYLLVVRTEQRYGMLNRHYPRPLDESRK